MKLTLPWQDTDNHESINMCAGDQRSRENRAGKEGRQCCKSVREASPPGCHFGGSGLNTGWGWALKCHSEGESGPTQPAQGPWRHGSFWQVWGRQRDKVAGEEGVSAKQQGTNTASPTADIKLSLWMRCRGARRFRKEDWPDQTLPFNELFGCFGENGVWGQDTSALGKTRGRPEPERQQTRQCQMVRLWMYSQKRASGICWWTGRRG